MDIKELFLYNLWDMFIKNVYGVPDATFWPVMLQILLGQFLPLITLYKMMNRKNDVEKFICCIIPSILVGVVSALEVIIFGYFCSGKYFLDNQLVYFLHNSDFFKESLIVCFLFILCSVAFTILSRRVTKASVIQLILNQIVEYLIVVMVIRFSYDYLIKSGNAFFKISNTFIKWYIYGLWILVKQSAFYLFCVLCYILFCDRRTNYIYENKVSSEKWFADYLSDNYRGMGVSSILFGGMFLLIGIGLFKENRKVRADIYISFMFVIMAVVAFIAGCMMLLFSFFPKLLGSYKMIYKGQNMELMVDKIYQELEQESPLERFEHGRGFITKNFVVLYLPLRIYYIPFWQFRKRNWFYFSDGRKFFLHEFDAKVVRSYLECCHKEIRNL